MFQNSSNVHIAGGTFVNNYIGLTTFDDLKQVVSTNAFHDSGHQCDPPKCHEGTRIAVLDRIMSWTRIPKDSVEDQPPKPIMWLNGNAGAGKTAIARSIAEKCETEGLLLASFFFSRTDPTRNHAGALIPTIAYQMVKVLHQLRPHIEEIIARDPLIFKRSLETQILTLIVTPMQKVSHFPSTRTIIIDGLDECNDTKGQETILNVIANILRHHRTPLFFLIASRPERTIADAFNFKFTGIHERLQLNDSFNPDADIRLFLRESFNKIKQTHSLRFTIPHPWPTSDTLDTLVRKASGQFIYASVVKKYVEFARDSPASRLDIVLGLQTVDGDNPFAELDALYKQILQDLVDKDTAMKLLIFLCLSFSGSTQAISNVSKFLGIQLPKLFICLGDLRSLLNFSISSFPGSEGQNISVSHASFSDFLFDPSRSGQFYTSKPMGHTMIAQQCLKTLSEHSAMQKQVTDCYSAQFYVIHCTKAITTKDLWLQVVEFSNHIEFHYLQPQRPGMSMPCLIDWVEQQPWEDSQEVYAHLCHAHQNFVQNMASKYFQHPKTTLLLVAAASAEKSTLNILAKIDYTIRGAVLEDIFMMDPELDYMDQTSMTLITDMSMSAQPSFRDSKEPGKTMEPVKKTAALHGRTLNCLEDMLDKERYSTSIIALIEYLCDHSTYNRTHCWYKPFRLDRQHTQPWRWHQMRKSRGMPEIEQRYRKECTMRLQHQEFNLGVTDPVDEQPMQLWKHGVSPKSFKLALHFLALLLPKVIVAPGNYDPQLVPLVRQCTFAMPAMKFPCQRQDAKAAIAQFLAYIDVEERGNNA